MRWSCRDVLAVVCLTLVAGCTPAAHEAPASGPQVTVTAKDFKLSVSSASWPRGTLRVVFHNLGPDTHELLMFRASEPADSMPMRPDGITVDEDSARLRSLIDEVGTDAGGSQTVTVHLTPGHYVIICNMAGHYMAGMRQDVTVG
jgi:uncharacterized cupredoxin-like copper-binding protein